MSGFRGALGTSYDGGSPPLQVLRQYDYSDEVISKHPRLAPLYAFFSKTLKKKLVTDPIFKHIEDDVRYYKGFVQGGDGAGAAAAITATSTTFLIADADKHLQEDEFLMVGAGQANDTNTTSTRLIGERMRISNVSGNDVTVVRETPTAENPTANSGDTLQFFILPAPNHEGSRSRDAMQDVLTTGMQYTQMIRCSIDATADRMAMKTWGGADLPRLRDKTLQFVLWNIERAFLHNDLGHQYVDGKQERVMKGILPWLYRPKLNTPTGRADPDTSIENWVSGTDLVSGDGSSRVYNVAGSLTWANLVTFLDRAFQYGANDKLGLCGSTFLAQLQTMYSHLVRLEAVEQMWGLNVKKFVTPSGGVLNLVVEPAFEGTTAMNLLVLDVDPLGYAYLNVAEGAGKYSGKTDIRLIKGIGANDYPGAKDEVWCQIAIRLANLQSQAWMTGVTGFTALS